MKFIVLNPHFQESGAVEKLKGLGVHLLFCSDPREAELVLKIHGRSVSLILGHDDDGLRLNKMVKANPTFAEIPFIFSTTKWSNEQAAQHKSGPEAFNGYIRLPVEDHEWLETIDAVIQTYFGPSNKIAHIEPAVSVEGDNPLLGGIKIENAASVYSTSAADKKATENSSVDGIELDGLFGSGTNANGILETSGRKDGPSPGEEKNNIDAEIPDLSSLELSAEAVKGDIPISEAENIPIASPVESDGKSLDGIDFSLDSIASEAANESNSINLDDPTSESTNPTVAHPSSRVLNPPTSQQTTTQVAESTITSAAEEVDDDALVEMPYLSANRRKYSGVQTHVPLNDALIPGGSANPPDTETLKKYLNLRELDVATLSQQLQLSKDHIHKIESELKKQKADTTELSFLAQEQEARIKNFEKEKQIALESAVNEAQELKFEMKKRMDKIRLLEIQVRDSSQEAEKIKERVRGDIRKIRSREKELENRLEIMRKDSEALLAARENRIIELKRKLDLIEFNMDILQNQYEKEKQLTSGLKGKLEKAAQVVRVAEGLLHPTEQMDMGDILTQDLNKDEKTKVA